jgi:alkylated DNA repair dioxygenase AlkB
MSPEHRALRARIERVRFMTRAIFACRLERSAPPSAAMPVRACLPVSPPAAPSLPPRAKRLAAKRALRERARLDAPPQPHEPPPSSSSVSPPFAHHAAVLPHLRLPDLLEELAPLLRRETVVAASGVAVEERRETCWLSDSGNSFTYSGKVMRGGRLTPQVAAVRDALATLLPGTTTVYDSVLVNHYPSGESAMRFHSDPQGEEWAEETAVVSVGATRRFAFRSRARPSDTSSRTVFEVQNGDVVRMWGDCQARLQHALLPAEPGAATDTARLSLVFKLCRAEGAERVE